MSKFGQFAASSQFYLYGRKHFTRTGWETHSMEYERPDFLSQNLDLSECVYMITGANSGIGREVAQYLVGQNATVYMVCRNRERAHSAVAEITAATGNNRVHFIEADVSREGDVRRCMTEFAVHSGARVPRLDALFCNAGALLKEMTMTDDNIEATFATHLLFGTYLMGSLAMPSLNATPGSRLIAMSSGGIYNFAFPDWSVAASIQYEPVPYDGQNLFAYANRGKVLLCERWAQQFPAVKVVSCHPGWTDTPAVEAAYSETKKYLEPMRTPWEGAEGIIWLCVAPVDQIISGAFYLDRKPQVKHMAGPFFTEGSHTKNTPDQVDAMMRQLKEWSMDRSESGRWEFQEVNISRGTPF